VILEAITQAGYKRAGTSASPWTPPPPNSGEGKYVFRKSDGSTRDSARMVKFYEDLCRQYPIISIEDGFSEDDWTAGRCSPGDGKKIQIVGTTSS